MTSCRYLRPEPRSLTPVTVVLFTVLSKASVPFLRHLRHPLTAIPTTNVTLRAGGDDGLSLTTFIYETWHSICSQDTFVNPKGQRSDSTWSQVALIQSVWREHHAKLSLCSLIDRRTRNGLSPLLRHLPGRTSVCQPSQLSNFVVEIL